MKYRVTRNESEIDGIIHNSVGSVDSILWQNLGVYRNIFKVLGIQIDTQYKYLYIKFDVGFSTIDPTSFIYIKLSDNQSVFKAKVLEVNMDVITIHVPQELQTIEKRKNARKKIKSYQDASIQLAMSQNENFAKPHVLKFRLIDISLEGFSIQVSKTNLDFINACVLFQAVHLNGKKMSLGKSVQKCYSRSVIKNKNGNQKVVLRIGFSFDKPFDVEELKTYF